MVLHSLKPIRPGRLAGAGAVSTLLCLALAGCQNASPSGQASGPAVSVGCPDDVAKTLDPAAKPTTDLRVLIDPTGSFDHSSPNFRAQFTALATTAVGAGARLTVTVLGGTASGVETALSCPALTPLVRSEAARPRLTKQLVTRLDDALWNGYQQADDWDKKGSDIVGGFRAVADNPPTPGANLVVIAWTDGLQNMDTGGVQVSMPQATVLMFGIGHTAGGSLSTPQAERLVAQWKARLAETGADPVRVSLDSYTGGLT